MPSYLAYKTALDKLKWITLKNNRKVPIKEGQTVEEAVRNILPKTKDGKINTKKIKRFVYSDKEFECINEENIVGFHFIEDGKKAGGIDGKKDGKWVYIRSIDVEVRDNKTGRALVDLMEINFGKIKAKPSKDAEKFWAKIGFSEKEDGYWTRG